MRKFALLLILPFLLVACGGTDTTAAPSTDDLFVEVVRDEISFDASDAELVRMGHQACAAIDEGATLADFSAIAFEYGIDHYDFGYFIGASVGAYCPEHEGMVG